MVNQTMTYDEWRAEGKRLFGDDDGDWRFVCPMCEHVQTPRDFGKYKDQGAKPDMAAFNCIGRFTETPAKAFGTRGKKILGPCDYTSGGLFNVNPVELVMKDGSKYRIFAFDNSKDVSSNKAGVE